MRPHDQLLLKMDTGSFSGPWHKLSKLLNGECAKPCIFGMFCKAVVHTVLLFGCESWTLTDVMSNVLKGFHCRAAGRVANMMAYKGPGGGLFKRHSRRLVCVSWNTVSTSANNTWWTKSPPDLFGCTAWRQARSMGLHQGWFASGSREEGRQSLLTSTGSFHPPPLLGSGPWPQTLQVLWR